MLYNFLRSVLTIAFLTTTFIGIQAQENFSLGLDIGTMDFEDNYSISINGDYEVMPWLSVAPTFTQITNLNGSSISPNYSPGGLTFGYSNDLQVGKQYHEYGLNLTAIDLNFLVKPFGFFQNEKLANHDLFLGAGFGFRAYDRTRASYTYDGQSIEVENYFHKELNEWAPTYLILGYRYQLCDHFSAGVSTKMLGYDGEVAPLTGFSAGFNF